VYAGNLYGGVERMLATLAPARVEGLEQAFALSFDGRLADELRRMDARVDLLGPVRVSRPWTAFRARSRLARVIRENRPDVVVCHSTWVHGIFAPVARRAGVPLAFWLHDVVRGGTWADRLATRTPPALAVCTSRFAQGALGRLWAHVPAEVVYPPVPEPRADAAARLQVRAEMDTPFHEVVFLMASRFDPAKGHRVLLDALASMPEVKGWTCWIAGGASTPREAAHLAAMRALAEGAGIAGRVRFLGERADVPRLMAAADVLCQPNLAPDAFGIAFVEGMYAGLPVVTSALGGALEAVAPTTGILVAPGRVDALAEALRELAGSSGRRAELGAAGPARARALCDPHQQAERMRQVLATVAGEG
jgi:glycosyltransferase involved in cell wall biosynthesis